MEHWALTDALNYAWDQLLDTPIAPSSVFARPWVSVLASILTVQNTLEDASPVSCLDADLKALSTDFLMLYVAGDTAVHESLDKIFRGFIDAGTDVRDW